MRAMDDSSRGLVVATQQLCCYRGGIRVRVATAGGAEDPKSPKGLEFEKDPENSMKKKVPDMSQWMGDIKDTSESCSSVELARGASADPEFAADRESVTSRTPMTDSEINFFFF